MAHCRAWPSHVSTHAPLILLLRVHFAHICTPSVCFSAKRLQQEQSLEWQPGMGQVFNPLLEAEERKREQKHTMTRKQKLNAGRPELPAVVWNSSSCIGR